MTAARATAEPVALGTPAGRWLLAACVLASGTAFLDATAVNVALPSIGRELGSSLSGLQWTVTAYTLTLAALILLGGSLGDRYGRRRMFLLGVIWFAAASLLCGLAQGTGELAAARAVQGAGGALLVPGSLALVTSGHLATFHVPLWVIFASALAISAGTYSGGFRIIRTLGRRVIQLQPAGGFAAQSVASGVMIATATVFAVPVSTTHITTASIMGVGSTRRFSAVRWGVAGNIVIAWVLTLPAAGLVAALAYAIVHAVAG